ncbi:tetratricopeptide repeat protein [Atopomonas sediminilitoris]|uniref:tetratricopeptide repeat protein n=1 Tax=Atopomonas sediminilitoris TaxID=2919919 RepID=UPI001F4EE4B0|nr:tetratricopeptide repeat protein [Atopomonas sediminilitoris]MCJ8169829.1 sel1 repeat family protein [Atopomonas sediminilitoris]
MTLAHRLLIPLTLCLSAPLWALDDRNTLLLSSDERCLLSNTSGETVEQALASCTQWASNGERQAQFELGQFWLKQPLERQDLPQALHWLELASLQGQAEAQRLLGLMYWQGQGVEPSSVQAYIILKMAAVNGSDQAMDDADRLAEHMQRSELAIATQVLGDIFRRYLDELQALPSNAPAPIAPLITP